MPCVLVLTSDIPGAMVVVVSIDFLIDCYSTTRYNRHHEGVIKQQAGLVKTLEPSSYLAEHLSICLVYGVEVIKCHDISNQEQNMLVSHSLVCCLSLNGRTHQSITGS